MSTPIKKYFRRYNGSSWDIIYFYTDASAVAETSDRKFVTATEKSNIATALAASHSHSNKSILDATTASYTTAEQTKLSGIETGAQVNTVTQIKINNGSAVSPTSGTTRIDLSIDKSTVGLGNVENAAASGLYVPLTRTIAGTALSSNISASDLRTALSLNNVENAAASGLYVPLTSKGQASGVASLDSNGKISMSQLPDTITGQLVYGGIVNFSDTSDSQPVSINESKATITLSDAGKVKLNTANNTIGLETARATTGLYFIVGSYKSSTITNLELTYGTSSPHATLSALATGDWIVVLTSTTLGKVDNSDAITAVKFNNTLKYGLVEITADEVKAAVGDHSSTSDTYGKGTTSKYGHVKTQTGDMNGTSSTDGIAAGLGHTHSQYLTAHQSVSSSNNTASWGSAVVVGTVGGTQLKFTMPSNPNTNTWRPIQVTGVSAWTDNSKQVRFVGAGSVNISATESTEENIITITGSGGTSIADSAPSNPQTGDLWFSASAS